MHFFKTSNGTYKIGSWISSLKGLPPFLPVWELLLSSLFILEPQYHKWDLQVILMPCSTSQLNLWALLMKQKSFFRVTGKWKEWLYSPMEIFLFLCSQKNYWFLGLAWSNTCKVTFKKDPFSFFAGILSAKIPMSLWLQEIFNSLTYDRILENARNSGISLYNWL